MNIQKVIVVAKDMGGANVTLPVAQLLQRQGMQVTLILEGLAGDRFIHAGMRPYFKGTVNFQQEPFSLDATAVLTKIKPDVVICAEGAPINLEQSFGVVANAMGIPLVEINDFWRGAIRSHAKPNLICTMDKYDARVSQASFPKAKVAIVGNAGIKESFEIVQSVVLSNLRNSFGRIVLYVGSDEATMEELELLKSCLRQMTGSWCLVPRFHPKYDKLEAPQSGGKTFGEVWRSALSGLGERVFYSSVNKTEDFIPYADVVCASFSTLLTTAAANGTSIVVALSTPGGSVFLENAKLDEVPQVELGCAHKVSKPTNLFELDLPSRAARDKLIPYDPQRVLGAIRAL